MSDTPTPAPAPMTAADGSIERVRLASTIEAMGPHQWAKYTYASDVRVLLERFDALTARVAELDRLGYRVNEQRQMALEEVACLKRSLAGEIEKSERLEAELAAAKLEHSAWVHGMQDGALLRDMKSEIVRLEAELAAARKVPDDADIAAWLRSAEEAGGPLAKIGIAIVTRLSAALEEAEREKATRQSWARAELERLANVSIAAEARTQAAEAKLESARRDVLEEAATLCTALTFSDTTPTLRPGARMCAHRLRALQTKDTTI